ncbi:MAG: hypothetical protein ACI89L_002867 [Phycisphaerales bacterium]|jgi:hypothetical protein
MNQLGITACSLSVLLAAVAGQAPCAAGVLFEKELVNSNLNTLDVFGLSHTAVGNAQLSMSPTGTLVVSNIGSSGLDGVTVPIGDARGLSMSMDMDDMGALSPGGLVEVFYPYQFGETRVYVAESSGGSGVFGVSSTGTPGVCSTVSILHEGQVVDATDWPDATPGASNAMVTGDMGSDPATGQGVRFSCEQVGADYVYTMTLPQPTLLTIAGRGTVYGATIQVATRGRAPGQTVNGPVRIMAANTADIEILSMSLTMPYWEPPVPGGDPFEYRRTGRVGVRATGPQQKISGMAEAEACQAHPKAWFFGNGGLTPARVLAVSNIGSSGLDGVSIDFDNWSPCGPGFFQCANNGRCVAVPAECSPGVADRIIHFGGTNPINPDYLDLDSDGDTLVVGARGNIGGGTGSGLGSIQLANEAGTIDEVSLTTDFKSLGATLVRVEVYNDGVYVGEFEDFEAQGQPMASVAHVAEGLDLTGCGKLGGGPLGPPCFFFTTMNPVTVTGVGALPLVGNEVRVLAVDVATPIEFISELHLIGTNLEDFDFRMDMAQDTGLYETALGVQHHAEGAAQLSTNLDGRLVVSNIGSSGEDGVTVDLGESSQASVVFPSLTTVGGLAFTPFEFVDLAFGTFEPDDDNLCTVGMRLQAGASASDLTLTVTGEDPAALLDITLRDAAGNLLGTFTMDQTQSVLLNSHNGGDANLSKADSKRALESLSGPIVECMICHLVAGPGGGGGVGFSAESPAGVLFSGVSSIEVCQRVPGGPGKRYFGHVTVLKAQGPGGGGGPLSDIEIELIQLAAMGMPANTLGNARFWMNQKMKEAEVAQLEEDIDDCVRLSLDNLGSSGCDGVSISLNDESCNALDNDCDSEVDGGWVELQSMDHNGDGELKVIINSKKSPAGSGAVNDAVYFVTSVTPGPAGSDVRVSMTDDVGTPYAFRVRTEVYDAAGVLLAFEDETAHPVYPTASPLVINLSLGWERSRFDASVDLVGRPAPLGGGVLPHFRTWDSVRHNLYTPQPVILPRSGQVVQNASAYRVTVFHEVPIAVDHLESMDLLFTDSSLQGGSYNIFGAGALRAAAPCPADTNGDGVIDNGDIGVFITLFLAQDPAVDFTGDGIVDNGDIGAFIAAFLAGC